MLHSFCYRGAKHGCNYHDYVNWIAIHLKARCHIIPMSRFIFGLTLEGVSVCHAASRVGWIFMAQGPYKTYWARRGCIKGSGSHGHWTVSTCYYKYPCTVLADTCSFGIDSIFLLSTCNMTVQSIEPIWLRFFFAVSDSRLLRSFTVFCIFLLNPSITNLADSHGNLTDMSSNSIIW